MSKSDEQNFYMAPLIARAYSSRQQATAENEQLMAEYSRALVAQKEAAAQLAHSKIEMKRKEEENQHVRNKIKKSNEFISRGTSLSHNWKRWNDSPPVLPSHLLALVVVDD